MQMGRGGVERAVCILLEYILVFLQILSGKASLNSHLFFIPLTKQVTGTVALPCTTFNFSYFILKRSSPPRLIYLLRVPKNWEHRLDFANIPFHFASSCGRAVPSVEQLKQTTR